MLGSRRGFVVGVLLVVVACDAPRPTPSPEVVGPTQAAIETPTSSPGSSAPSSSARPIAPPPPPRPSSADLIRKASADGTIDEATGYLYRFYAQWGDARLPEAYRGAGSEDIDVGDLALAAMDRLTPDEQARLQPFVVRPTDPGSYWNVPPTTAARSGGAHLAAFMAPVAGICSAAGWSRVDLSAIPVSIHAKCHLDAGAYVLTLGGVMAEVGDDLTAVWTPMTNLMGKPRGDQFVGSAKAPNEVEEAGDGRLDIYIVEQRNEPYPGRDLEIFSPAAAYAAPRYDLGRSSAYIVYDPTARAGASRAFRKTILAHEFFHALQYAHNSIWNSSCPYPNVVAPSIGPAPCAPDQVTSHWFVEASATWAEFEFVKEARPERGYFVWQDFLTSGLSLSSTDGINAYSSSQWALFMQQESPTGKEVIADAWRAMEGKQGWMANQIALDGVMPFAEHFRDFAVRVWNERLEPGDPISPRFQGLDPGFPTVQPGHTTPAPRYREPLVRVNADFQKTQTFTEDIPDLWASYYDLTIDQPTKRLTFNFGALQPNGNLDVDALVRVRDIGWQRRALDPLVTEWCLDKAADAIEQVILVLSNHSGNPHDNIKGTWTVEAAGGGCVTVSDGLAYTSTSIVGTPGAGIYQKRFESLSMHVDLDSNQGTSEFSADYLNRQSTFRAVIQTEGFQETVDPSCPIESAGAGDAAGPVPGLDGVVASLTQRFDPQPGQTAEPEGRWVLSVAGQFRVDVITSTTSCLGSDTVVTEETISLPTCDGVEVIDEIPGRTFAFHCVESGLGLDWSLTGRVTLYE